MVEGSRDLSFPLKSGNAVGVLCELFRQNLDRHSAAKDLILSLKNLTHAAFANLIGDLIMPERLADHEEALHVDSRCNAMEALEVGAILARRVGFSHRIGW